MCGGVGFSLEPVKFTSFLFFPFLSIRRAIPVFVFTPLIQLCQLPHLYRHLWRPRPGSALSRATQCNNSVGQLEAQTGEGAAKASPLAAALTAATHVTSWNEWVRVMRHNNEEMKG